jgi:uncharacterized UBP type Zn finger protein
MLFNNQNQKLFLNNEIFSINIDLTLSTNEKIFNYELVSVVFHIGLTVQAGHYICKLYFFLLLFVTILK